MSERLIVGAMSGTSADGVDVAITAINGRGRQMQARLVAHHHLDYPAIVRDAIFQIRVHGHTRLRSLSDLARQISLMYAAAIGQTLAKANLTSQSISAIAAHGQTLFHDAPLTLQWLDPALLAWETGCPVISDFRRADCAAGGQGAPLVPFADYILFRDQKIDRILLNIGGIANLSWLPAGAEPDHVIAYDCGPGNCLSDWICRTFRPDGPGYDEGGNKALNGKVRDDLAQQFLNEDYFKLPPPKSTDGPAMIGAFE
ncbi:MAG TPA: anhydro-N-acetylmuramic acid kinase, partial [Tepidisphaeraceae bacterium]|nr:anhydro-N-acetylmuramic acid kinase [Tepidisphaeraceae bacterium]